MPAPLTPRARLAALALSLAALAGALGAAGASCSSPSSSGRYSRREAQRSLGKLESPGLVLGEFRVTKVVDGDTVRVDGLDASLRLLGIDAEETFKHESERRAFEAGWAGYIKQLRGDSKRPVKGPTPMGEAAKEWGLKWFAGVGRVRVERDHAAEIRDRYDRYLAYVIAEKDGRWLNYNVELVRAGLSPYFPKYGNSRRFHKEFVEAEAEAKAQQRGIWKPGAMAYPDYPEREAWWKARADFVEAFRKEGEGKPGYVDITHVNAMTELEENVGKEVHLLATIDDVVRPARGPARARLSHSRHRSFSLVFFDPDVLAMSGVDAWRGEYIVVTGAPTFYEHKGSGEKELQIVIDRASQIRLSQVPGLTPPAAALGAAPAAGAPATAPPGP
jgi:endonuclease YncB( thermonuclease family)